MKNYVILVLMLVASLPAVGQNENFKIENNNIIWQKVYKTDLDFEHIHNEATISGKFSEIQIIDSLIIGKFYEVPGNYAGIGFQRGSVAIYVLISSVNATFKVEYKPGRYRVTIYNLQLIEAKGTKTDLNVYAIKNGDLNKTFLKKPSQIYNYTFNELFTFKEKKKNDNW